MRNLAATMIWFSVDPISPLVNSKNIWRRRKKRRRKKEMQRERKKEIAGTDGRTGGRKEGRKEEEEEKALGALQIQVKLNN